MKRRTRRDGVTSITVSQFKARCSELVAQVAAGGGELVITRRGQPMARLVPEGTLHRRSPRGSWKGLVAITGDIVESDWSGEFEVLADR